MNDIPRAGLYETLLTERSQRLIDLLPKDLLFADTNRLENAEASDRVSRHVAQLIARAVEAAPEHERAATAVKLAAQLLSQLESLSTLEVSADIPLEPGQVLDAVLRRRPDGTLSPIDRPLTPLLDTTVFTNAPGEPALAHELRAEIPSSDAIDVVMAFIRFSGGALLA